MACPTGVKIAEMNARARAQIVAQGGIPIRKRLRNNLIARTELIGKIGQPIAPFANYMLSNGIIRKATQVVLGIHHAAPLPAFTKQKFTTWFKRHATPKNLSKKVVYFHGCSTQYYEPWVGRAAIHVLEINGFEVIVPPQNCCGLPLLSNGEFSAAQRYHQNNVDSLLCYAKQGIPIVGTSTSCTLTLKEEAPELLDMHDDATTLVSEMTFDFNEFLLKLYDEGSLNLNLRPIELSLPYHAPCQYRGHRLGKPAVEILGFVPCLQVFDSHATCCGIAGTYGYKEEKYNISMEVGNVLFKFIQEFDPPVAICDSETCRWQITHATGIPAVHPAELLAASYGFEPEGALKNALEKSRT
jgi:glycerol-3-phosphate dehydrogenase subunit C